MNAAAADPAFRTLPDLVREHAAARPAQPALVQGDSVISYGELDALMDRVAAALQRDGLRPGDAIAACAHSGPHYAAVFLGALRAGVVVAPLAPSVTPRAVCDRCCAMRRPGCCLPMPPRRRCCAAPSRRPWR